ncbi:MAG: aminomethyl-transferring glycine dehydrogenase subunit GcvPA [Candidatus Marinimicrobia bacterium]|nr:aminomethyl-transferring glycine dehydrogenase subunit GcvPA [Candidatus Neomarinimicrobiota bacterium]
MVYIPNSEKDFQEMLKTIGVKDFEELIKSIPEELKSDRSLPLPEPLTEMEIEAEIKEIASRNRSSETLINFMGGGVYDHYIPKVVDYILSRSEFKTAYTPYQPEVSQGTLQAMYEYQSMICELTGMDVSNASLYDGATGLSEAAMMARNITNKNHILISETVHPLYLQVLKTYAGSLKLDIEYLPFKNYITDLAALDKKLNNNTAAVILQSPNFYGYLENASAAAEKAHSSGALFIQGFDPISLAILRPPGDYETDIVFGEGQALGNHLNFGGPYLGLFAAKRKYIRKMPGRIVSVTEDTQGKRGFVLTLQTREQHIRREKATSNICTNQGLNALAATVYLALLGKGGFQKVAELCTQKAHYLHDNILKIEGFKSVFEAPFFKEFTIHTPIPAAEIVQKAEQAGFLAGVPVSQFYPERDHELIVAVTEKRTKAQMDSLITFLRSL